MFQEKNKMISRKLTKKAGMFRKIERDLNLHREMLKSLVSAIGWEGKENSDYLISQTKSLLKEYIKFKEAGKRYGKADEETRPNCPLESIYSFQKDLEEVLLLFEKNKYIGGINGFEEVAEKYYKGVKEGIYSDIFNNKKEKSDLTEIRESLQNIRKYSAFPYHVWAFLDGE
jgi:hypothetical protein